ncbi:MAG: FMN-binding protein [Roseibacillus sp.]
MAQRSLRRIQVGAYRLLVLGALVAALVFGSRARIESGWSAELVLSEAREVMSEVHSVGPFEEESAELLDEKGELVGHVAMTSPASDAAVGYAGPTNVLVVFDAGWKVKGMRVLSSADTWSHLRKVEQDESFWAQWVGRAESELPAEISVVSGATLTSEAIGDGLRARFSGEQVEGPFMKEPSLEVVREVFEGAEAVNSVAGKEGVFRVVGPRGSGMGFLLRSGNQGGQPRGFNGASDVWVFLDEQEETVVKVLLVGSRDNEPYLSDVREELKWADVFEEKRVSELLGDETASDQVLVVSGATVTSRALVETVRTLLRDYREPEIVERWWETRDSVLVGWVLLAIGMGYSRWKGAKKLRWATDLAAILVGGIWLGVMVGMGSLVGWSRGELPWSNFPGLVLLAAVALMIPVATGKNTYCAKLCAHGAAQGILFRLTKWRWVPSSRWHKRLKMVPVVTLIAVFLLAAGGLRFDFSSVEPFDVWSVGIYALVPVVIFSVGLVASLFIPKAYCKYGCPTGYLLDHLAASRSRLNQRDWVAGGLAVICWVVVLFVGRMG